MQSDDVKISASDMRELMHAMQESANIQFYDTKLNPLSIDDYVVREFAGGDYRVTVSPYILNEAKANKRKANNSYNENKEQHRHEEEMNKILNDRMKTYQKAQSERDKQDAENEKQQKEDQKSTSRDNDWRDANRMHNNTAFLKDQDIKKMNDALPSILIVKFYQKNSNDAVSGVATEFLIGIKSKVVPITTTEILRRIMNDNKDGQKFLKFMRVITGELKASDVLLGLSRITDDVKSYKVKGARGDIWTLLQNRAVAAKEQVRSGKHNDFSAITTVLISQQDADELYREENFDINDPKNAIHFMQSYNLMGFAIADDSNEVLHLLLDNGSKNFEDISYRMLERETQDSTYKKLINLMAASK